MRLISVKELSGYLRVKESTLYSWVHTGNIPYFKLNGLLRFDMEEIEHWIQETRAKSLDIAVNVKKKGNLDIDKIVKRTILEVKKERSSFF